MPLRDKAMTLFSVMAGTGHILLMMSALIDMNMGRLGYASLNFLACAIVFLAATGLVAQKPPVAGLSMVQRLKQPFVYGMDAFFALAFPGALFLMVSGLNAQAPFWSQVSESAAGACTLAGLVVGLALHGERVWKVGPVSISSLAIPAVLLWVSTLSLLNAGWVAGNSFMIVAALLFCVANTIMATLKKA